MRFLRYEIMRPYTRTDVILARSISIRNDKALCQLWTLRADEIATISTKTTASFAQGGGFGFLLSKYRGTGI
jgi:hypothetical protein